MKPRLYIETTVPSYLTSRPSSDIVTAGHQLITKDWWELHKDKFETFVSQIVIDEAKLGNPQAAQERLKTIEEITELEVTDDALRLAKHLLTNEIIPAKAGTDAFHIAVATVHEMQFLITWNCSHIANGMIIKRVEQLCKKLGYECPTICTPEELMGDNYAR